MKYPTCRECFSDVKPGEEYCFFHLGEKTPPEYDWALDYVRIYRAIHHSSARHGTKK